MTISQELDRFLKTISEIPVNKKYWLVRTLSGQLYETFRENNFVAIEHNEIKLSFLDETKKQFGDDSSKIINAIRNRVKSVHEHKNSLLEIEDEISNRTIGLIASQIFRFVYEVKKGDIVIIPSINSDLISFGIATENFIAEFTPEEQRKIDNGTILKKRIKWIKDIQRIKIDPYLHRMFSSHQALNDVSAYAEVIERSLKNFFILDNEAHLVLNVLTENEIPAKDLFGMGSEILNLVDEFAKYHNIDISSNDLQVTLNLNSPGKIDLKSKIKKTTTIAGIILLVVGGGYEDKAGHSLKSPGLPALIKAVDDFLAHKQDREIKQQIFDKYKDSLQVETPDDMVILLKQFSENKDNPK